MKAFLIFCILFSFSLSFSLLEQGVPIQSIIHSQHRESFLINVQLNVAYGKVQFAVDFYNRTQNYMTMDLSDYKWKSGICSKQNLNKEDYQIMASLSGLFPNTGKAIPNKVKKLIMNQKLIVTIEAQENSKYRLAVAKDRIYLKPNSQFQFLLPKHNDTISYVVEASGFFLLNTIVKSGQVKLNINRLSEELKGQAITTPLSHQPLPIKEIVQNSELMFDQVIKEQESLQIGNKRKSVIQYVVTFQNVQENPVYVDANWSQLQSQQIQSIQNKPDSFYSDVYNLIIGYGIPQGKQVVKISIMICFVISFLLYAIAFVFKNMSNRKYKALDEWHDDEDDKL